MTTALEIPLSRLTLTVDQLLILAQQWHMRHSHELDVDDSVLEDVAEAIHSLKHAAQYLAKHPERTPDDDFANSPEVRRAERRGEELRDWAVGK